MANPLVDLASQITHTAKIIDSFIAANGYPQPSFDADAPHAFPPAPKEILDARRQLLDASQAIRELVLGPAEYLRWFSCRVFTLFPAVFFFLFWRKQGLTTFSIMTCPVFGGFIISKSQKQSR